MCAYLVKHVLRFRADGDYDGIVILATVELKQLNSPFVGPTFAIEHVEVAKRWAFFVWAE